MKVFATREVEEAKAYAAAGGQALHLHDIIPDRNAAPRCFVNAVDRGEPIAHLFDRNRARLVATARLLGVHVIVVDRDGGAGQHIDLCAGPLRKCYKQLDDDQADRLREILDSFKPEPVADSRPSLPGCDDVS